MSHNFDTFPNRRNSDSGKWNHYDADVLPMWVADMDFVSPQPVLDALKKRVEHGVFGYPGDPLELTEAVQVWIEKHYGWTVEKEAIMLVPGVVTGLNWVCNSLAHPGQGALIQTPVYPPFLYAPANADLEKHEMQLTLQTDGSYTIDFDAFEAAIQANTQIFILCNPHNPVGRVFTPEELERLAEICLRKNVIICSDEIHADLIYAPNRHVPIASLSPEIAKNTVTLIAPSKTFNIAGLECSVAIATNPEIRQQLRRGGRGMSGWVNVMGQTAALAAYRYGEPWLNDLIEYLQGNRDYLYRFVRDEMPGVEMGLPEGTYLAWLDCRKAVNGNPHEFFLEKARVAVNDGATFGNGGEGFVRLNFGCPRSMLEEALQRMKKALQG